MNRNKKTDWVTFILIMLSMFILFWALFMTAFTSKACGLEETYIPQQQVELCYEICPDYGICPEILIAMIEIESSGRMSAQNGDCTGILQIDESVWGFDYTTEARQIEKACQILTDYSEKCTEIAHVLDMYNGNSKASYYCEQGILSEYSTKVLSRSRELELIHYGL